MSSNSDTVQDESRQQGDHLKVTHALGVDRQLKPVKIEREELCEPHGGRERITTAPGGHNTYTGRFSVQGMRVDTRSFQDRPLEEDGLQHQSGLGINRQFTKTATELSHRTAHGRSPWLSLKPSSSEPPVASCPEESIKVGHRDQPA